MKDGFYTALGTALDEQGTFVASSYERQVDDQVNAGASGLLAMGSMGIQASVRDCDYVSVVKSTVDVANGKTPVLVGVMDNSIAKVKDRIDAIADLKVDGVVSTAPFYSPAPPADMEAFFTGIADASKFPLYLYDLPWATNTPMSAAVAKKLMQHENIKGIKTANMALVRVLERCPEKPADFDVMFSGLDFFDLAYKAGVKKNLDGMFSCMPETTSKMYKALAADDFETAGKCLDDILYLRDTFVSVGVMGGFSHAMNLLGYEGVYSRDYEAYNNPEHREIVREAMKKIGLL